MEEWAGSWFTGEKGRHGGINRKKRGGKAGSENPIVDPPMADPLNRQNYNMLYSVL